MRNVYKILAYLVAIEVVIQAMAISYGIAGVAHWVEEDNGVLNKAVFESDDPDFTGIGGFISHGINGTVIIPLLVIVLLIVSFFAKVPGGVRFAAIIFGLVALQVFLGIFSHSVPFVVVLHVLNAFLILGASLAAGRAASVTPAPAQASVAV